MSKAVRGELSKVLVCAVNTRLVGGGDAVQQGVARAVQEEAAGAGHEAV